MLRAEWYDSVLPFMLNYLQAEIYDITHSGPHFHILGPTQEEWDRHAQGHPLLDTCDPIIIPVNDGEDLYNVRYQEEVADLSHPNWYAQRILLVYAGVAKCFWSRAVNLGTSTSPDPFRSLAVGVQLLLAGSHHESLDSIMVLEEADMSGSKTDAWRALLASRFRADGAYRYPCRPRIQQILNEHTAIDTVERRLQQCVLSSGPEPTHIWRIRSNRDESRGDKVVVASRASTGWRYVGNGYDVPIPNIVHFCTVNRDEPSEKIAQILGRARGNVPRTDSDAFVPTRSIALSGDWSSDAAYAMSHGLAAVAETLGLELRPVGELCAKIEPVDEGYKLAPNECCVSIDGRVVVAPSSAGGEVVDLPRGGFRLVGENISMIVDGLADLDVQAELLCRSMGSLREPVMPLGVLREQRIVWPSKAMQQEWNDSRRSRLQELECEVVEVEDLAQMAADVPGGWIDRPFVVSTIEARWIDLAHRILARLGTKVPACRIDPPQPVASLQRRLANSTGQVDRCVSLHFDLWQVAWQLTACALMAARASAGMSSRALIEKVVHSKCDVGGRLQFSMGQWLGLCRALVRDIRSNMDDQLPATARAIRDAAMCLIDPAVDRIVSLRNQSLKGHGYTPTEGAVRQLLAELEQSTHRLMDGISWTTAGLFTEIVNVKPVDRVFKVRRRILHGVEGEPVVQEVPRSGAVVARFSEGDLLWDAGMHDEVFLMNPFVRADSMPEGHVLSLWEGWDTKGVKYSSPMLGRMWVAPDVYRESVLRAIDGQSRSC